MDFDFIKNYNVNQNISENYKPYKIDQVISHNKLKSFLIPFIENKDFPNLLLYGLPGIGKTCLIDACLQEIFGTEKYNVISLNASEKRGIISIKDLLLSFLKNNTNFSTIDLKIIILDEMDNMTIEGQNLIKTFIDMYKNVRFVLICNYEEKISQSLKIRCFNYYVEQPTIQEIIEGIKKILILENINISTSALKRIIKHSKNDIRKIMNILQCIKIVYGTKPIFDHNVIKYLDIPTRQDIIDLCCSLKTLSFDDFLKQYDIYKYSNLIQLIYDIYENIKLKPEQIIELANLEVMVFEGIENINFYAYLNSLFKL